MILLICITVWLIGAVFGYMILKANMKKICSNWSRGDRLAGLFCSLCGGPVLALIFGLTTSTRVSKWLQKPAKW